MMSRISHQGIVTALHSAVEPMTEAEMRGRMGIDSKALDPRVVRRMQEMINDLVKAGQLHRINRTPPLYTLTQAKRQELALWMIAGQLQALGAKLDLMQRGGK